MKTLAEIYEQHRTSGDVGHGDKGSIHSYIPVYEELLRTFRPGCTFLEIGLAQGLSLAMWREYMPNSTIIGVDKTVVFDPTPHEATGTVVIECDATHVDILKPLSPYTFDVIIDDGSHVLTDQLATFQLLKPKMNRLGLYIIEDLLDPERQIQEFRKLHHPVRLIDLRRVKGLFCDAMAVFEFQ